MCHFWLLNIPAYSGAVCIANKQNLLKRGGGGGGGWSPDPLDTPPGSAPDAHKHGCTSE